MDCLLPTDFFRQQLAPRLQIGLPDIEMTFITQFYRSHNQRICVLPVNRRNYHCSICGRAFSSRCPVGLVVDHSDQFSNLPGDLRTPGAPRPRFPPPVKPKALAMPFDDGLGFDNDQDLTPPTPESGHDHPEEPISSPQFRSMNRLVEDGKLWAQGENIRPKRQSRDHQRSNEIKERRQYLHKRRPRVPKERTDYTTEQGCRLPR
jgi:hypothetical protein